MSYFHRSIAAVILGLPFLAPGIVSAASITQGFTIQVPSGTPVGTSTNVASSSFQQLDLAVGRLTEVQTRFSGEGSWASSSASPRLELSVVTHNTAVVLGGVRFFFSPGNIRFNFSETDVFLPQLSSFIGSGTAQVDLRIAGSGGTFSTPLNEGSITYVYEPLVAAIPEPGGVWPACVGLLALGAFRTKWPTGV